MPEVVYNTAVYFQNTYADSWLLDDFARRAIKGAAKSEVLGSGAIDSPVLGIVSPLQLLGGVKTLLLIHNDHSRVFNASTCGDNCAPFLLELGEAGDVTVNLRHMMDFGRDRFSIHVLNSGVVVHDMRELFDAAAIYV